MAAEERWIEGFPGHRCRANCLGIASCFSFHVLFAAAYMDVRGLNLYIVSSAFVALSVVPSYPR